MISCPHKRDTKYPDVTCMPPYPRTEYNVQTPDQATVSQVQGMRDGKWQTMQSGSIHPRMGQCHSAQHIESCNRNDRPRKHKASFVENEIDSESDTQSPKTADTVLQ